MQNTGDQNVRTEVATAIEHLLSDRPGQWRVSIVGSQANDRWEMRITGPKSEGHQVFFERLRERYVRPFECLGGCIFRRTN
jgi:hypothetical protein